MAVTVPTFRAPFEFANGRARVIEKESQEHIDLRVDALLATPLGARVEKPDFGIPDTRFGHARETAGAIRAAVARWVPNAVTVVEADDTALLDRTDRTVVTSQEAARGE